MKKNISHRYEIGHRFIDDKRELIVLEKIRMQYKNHLVKGYKYQCLKCLNIDKMSEYNIKDGNGCNACCKSPKKVIKVKNSIYITHPHLNKYFINIDDAYNNTAYSHKCVSVKCLYCGTEKHDMRYYQLSSRGFSCICHSEGFSYPEKFMYNVLMQLKAKFKYQKKFKWSMNRIYDFYVVLDNIRIIIETHGAQHKNRSIHKRRTVEQEIQNDKLKLELALDKVDYYIVIDCSVSSKKFILNNIVNSRLNEIFDLNIIDWNEAEKFATSKIIDIIVEKFNERENVLPGDIARDLKLRPQIVSQYLKIANDLKLCEYNKQKIITISNRRNSKSKNKNVICLTTNKIFNSLSEAAEYYNVNITKISACCYNKQTYTSKLSDGRKLIWCFYDEYKKMSKEEIQNKINNTHSFTRSVICINNGEIFNSIKEAGEKYMCNPSNISKCCMGKFKTSGKDLISGERLMWGYI